MASTRALEAALAVRDVEKVVTWFEVTQTDVNERLFTWKQGHYVPVREHEAPTATVLHAASAAGALPVVIELMRMGANPSLVDGRGASPSSVATGVNAAGIVAALRSTRLSRPPELVSPAAPTSPSTISSRRSVLDRASGARASARPDSPPSETSDTVQDLTIGDLVAEVSPSTRRVVLDVPLIDGDDRSPSPDQALDEDNVSLNRGQEVALPPLHELVPLQGGPDALVQDALDIQRRAQSLVQRARTSSPRSIDRALTALAAADDAVRSALASLPHSPARPARSSSSPHRSPSSDMVQALLDRVESLTQALSAQSHREAALRAREVQLAQREALLEHRRAELADHGSPSLSRILSREPPPESTHSRPTVVSTPTVPPLRARVSLVRASK
jgi:hypothetical protein